MSKSYKIYFRFLSFKEKALSQPTNIHRLTDPKSVLRKKPQGLKLNNYSQAGSEKSLVATGYS